MLVDAQGWTPHSSTTPYLADDPAGRTLVYREVISNSMPDAATSLEVQ
jgi:hypothetical protein